LIFDQNVAYDINVDVNQDGKADDVVYRLRSKTAIRAPFNDLPVAYAGIDGVAGLPPAIRDLDGLDAAGLGLRQEFSRIACPRFRFVTSGLRRKIPFLERCGSARSRHPCTPYRSTWRSGGGSITLP